MGTLLSSCAKLIELSSGVVSGIGHGMGVIKGGPCAPRGGGGISRICCLHCTGGLNRHFQAKLAKYSKVHIMETTAWIPAKFCVAVKTTKYASCMVQ